MDVNQKPKTKRRLTVKQQVWLEEYLQCWNATEAARRAGYKSPRYSGYQNSAKRHIREEIHERLSAKAMGTDEVLMRLAEQARVDISTFFRIDDQEGEDGKSVVVDWDKILSEQGHLIKSITFGAHGPKIEVYDAQSALAHLAKHHGLLTNKLEVTGKDGGPIEVGVIRDALARRLAGLADAGTESAVPGESEQPGSESALL